MWLYRNDKGWLKEHCHPIHKENQNKSSLRVNWEKRDQELTEIVALIVSDILKEKKPFIKVTKNEVGRRLRGLPSFVKNLERLPNTMKVLNQSLETTEQFQIRRIKCVVEEMRITHTSIKEWEVIRAAGLKTKYSVKLKQVIMKEIYCEKRY